LEDPTSESVEGGREKQLGIAVEGGGPIAGARRQYRRHQAILAPSTGPYAGSGRRRRDNRPPLVSKGAGVATGTTSAVSTST